MRVKPAVGAEQAPLGGRDRAASIDHPALRAHRAGLAGEGTNVVDLQFEGGEQLPGRQDREDGAESRSVAAQPP